MAWIQKHEPGTGLQSLTEMEKESREAQAATLLDSLNRSTAGDLLG